MIISIEVPVVSGGWLIPTIESVLAQTSRAWRLHLLWDGGDALSKQILQKIEKHPQARVFYTERMGIASARRYLTERSEGEWILPLDHDDVLHKDCVRRFLAVAETRPWAGILRARRAFVDQQGVVHNTPDWFPFERRHYQRGMTTDLFNHAQPMIIRRSAYAQTSGWEGFPEYHGAGEDCDIFSKVEEVQEVELIDEVLYFYRLHDGRTSISLGGEPVALDMWRRIADRALQRRGLPLERTNDKQPFTFRELPEPEATIDDIDFVVPFWEADEVELEYSHRRPTEHGVNLLALGRGDNLTRALDEALWPIGRVEVFCSAPEAAKGVPRAVTGTLHAEILAGDTVIAMASAAFENAKPDFENVPLAFAACGDGATGKRQMRLRWEPAEGFEVPIVVMTSRAGGLFPAPLLMRLFRPEPGASRKSLDRCLASLRGIGVGEENIHVIEKRQSSAANRNDGFRAGTRPYVCFMDDDVEVLNREAFDVLLKAMNELHADLVGPKLLDAEGRIFCALPYFDPEGMPKPHGIGEVDRGQFDGDKIVTWLPSTCLLMRRFVGLAAGPWDTNYTGSQMEDVDYALKARARGFRCAYVGRAAVCHHNLQRNYRMSENLPYFKARWSGRPELFTEPAVEGN